MKFRKSIMMAVAALGITAVLGGTSAFAATYYHTHGFAKSAVSVNYWKDSSVASYGYTGLADTGIDSWRNITDNLTINEKTSEPTYFSIVTYVGNTISGMDVYGVVDHWTYGLFGWTQVNPDNLRDRARVRMDHTNLKSLGSDSTGYALKKYAFVHEFGHAVGLKHNNSGVASVMSESISSSTNTPQITDKTYLKEKYGDN
ncbi:hypothetical protein ACFSTH_09300 [Paenibacillus yanchengensis]|uniref:Matrixin family metalloprotease n=1 Tax=Paenibacillus yanchengensis TaxID=2035833 RepID=A0ABW4YGL1_9BACL